MILQRVSPVTHSIGNCLKRVIVIVASVIFFQNPMSQQNMIGAIPKPVVLQELVTFLCRCRNKDGSPSRLPSPARAQQRELQ